MNGTMLICVLLWALPAFAPAQMDEFRREYMKANQRYLSEKTITVTQRYLFSLDSANAVAFDSGYCYITKNDRVIHYQFNGVESFSDGTYLIRISNPGKYIVVSRNDRSDSSAVGSIFSEAFSSFKNVEKLNADDGVAQWRLTGGIYGVPAVEITIDTRESRILGILAELSADHPFVSQIGYDVSGGRHNVFVGITYSYVTELTSEQPRLSDYITVYGGKIVVAEKYRDYQLKVIE